jgi:tetratricopeptide (TPR) repeat protein
MTRARALSSAVVLILATALLVASGAWLGAGTSKQPSITSVDLRAPAPAPAAYSSGNLSADTAHVQERLRHVPADYVSWAALGLAYVQQARISVDPAYYPKAAGVLRRSLQLNSADNFVAMAGLGALDNARHEFARALHWAKRAEAINPSSSVIYGVETDALIELGRYPEAFAALQKMLDLRPDTASLARASYSWELRGRLSEARADLERALDDATGPADVVFARYYLAELALNQGDLTRASSELMAGLRADPSSVTLREGRAKLEASRGQVDSALRDFSDVTNRAPQPSYLIEYGELLQSLGRTVEAKQQYSLVTTEEALLRANGVNTDLEFALFEADHGDARQALRAARSEWSRRHSVFVADALAWALHVNHHDRDALIVERLALRLGTRSATFLYHRGSIELALGDRAGARRDLSAALATNAHFSPVGALKARAMLRVLGGGG